ncbi:MAG TPA: DUF6600 domain-containing protein [Variovorax sp.]
MNPSPHFLSRRAIAWLLGLLLLGTGLQAFAQQDPPGTVGSLGFHQGAVSFSPAGSDEWFDVVPNRPITSGDRLWTDHAARAEVYVGSTALRLDEQTGITLSQVDDATLRITASQGMLQVRVRDDLAGRRLEVDTENLAAVIDGPGDYRIETDSVAGTTRVAVAAGQVTLFGEGGQSQALGARQQLTTSGRDLVAVAGAPVRAGADFDRWVAERDRAEDQSMAARYVSPDVVGAQQLDGYGTWQSEPGYGEVWYPDNVGADWAPYSDGQWVNVAPWGWTWVDAAPWGFAPAHYGRWARIGPRWAWVPGPRHERPVYAPALVAFVGGAAGANAALSLGGGRNGVGWFPLAPGEAWHPDYRASQRYVEAANRAAFQRQVTAARNAGFANQVAPGAVTVVPMDAFGRGPIGRRDVVRLPPERVANIPAAMAAPVPPHNDHGPGGFGRPTANVPPAAPQMQQRPPQAPFQQAQQMQQLQAQQRAAQAQGAQAMQLQQAQQIQQAQRAQQAQQQAQQLQQAQRLQQEQQLQLQQAQHQRQEQQQLQQAQQRQEQEAMQQHAAQAQAQQQMQQLQMQQAQRQQQEMMQRGAQAQAQQQQQALRAEQQIQAQQRALQVQRPQSVAEPRGGQPFQPDRP